MTADLRLRFFPSGAGAGVVGGTDDGRLTVTVETPVVLETLAPDGSIARICAGYSTTEVAGEELIGRAEVVDTSGARFAVQDRWTPVPSGRWRLRRELRVLRPVHGVAVRLVLELAPRVTDSDSFGDWTYFAPGAMYDLNDLDGDLVDDYADTQTLVYREDRLTAMTVVAHHRNAGRVISLSRATVPAFDPQPERGAGETAFRQRTDIGSLGVFPAADGPAGCVLTSAYPFVERERSHALLVRERPGWGAFWPAGEQESFAVEYLVASSGAASPHDALWDTWLRRLDDLKPERVRLPLDLAGITRLRLAALGEYYVEDTDGTAGFVTNCHPQDGRQLGNVIQYGFTGQNLLNAVCLLRADADGAEAVENRRRARKVIDFYVADAARNPYGLVHALYNVDLHRRGSWWTGLLLPLAYAEPGADLEHLMGPLSEHLRPVITALRDLEGTYLRCLAEEYTALLIAEELERARGVEQPQWLDVAQRFGRFLLSAQRADGAFHRAYDFSGRALTEPDFWFGQTDVQQTSSTATVVPFLLRLARRTGDGACLAAARRAAEYVGRVFVDGLKHNGGIHDSMYAKPQLVDHESIIFAMRALLDIHEATGEERFLRQAVRAGRLVCTWTFLWDVPLPAGSTLGRHGFRSTGWTGCDTPGAGYVHPMGVIAVPDLVELARRTCEPAFLTIAGLILAGCNENVARPGDNWGYARPGLQEEGVLISWCWADDPMFDGTDFGDRGKGEGNKTCFPWISAVTVWAYQELLARYGTCDLSPSSGILEVDRAPRP